MSDKSAAQLLEALQKLRLPEDDDGILPKRWKNDDKDPGSNIARFYADWPKYEEYYNSLGVPCHHLTTDSSGNPMLQPRWWPSLQSAGFAETKHEIDTEFITLFRKVTVAEPEKPQKGVIALHNMTGGEREAVEMIVVPKTEVAGLEGQGWEV